MLNKMLRVKPFMNANNGGGTGATGPAGDKSGSAAGASGSVDGNAGPGAGASGGSSSSEGSSEGSGSISFDDFLKQGSNQAEFDRRVQKGIATAVANEHERLTAIFDSKLDEQSRLLKMTDAERTQYLSDKAKKDLADREAAITKRELSATAKDKLTTDKLPIGLAEILDYSSKEACDKSLETVTKVFNDAVNAAVQEQLKGGKPLTDGQTQGQKQTPDEALVAQITKAINGGF